MPGLSITGAVMLVRVLGIMQPVEWQMLDLGLRWRPDEPQDTRITLIEITEKDIQQDVLGYPISDRKLAEMIETLQTYEPRVIGLDIFRDRPIGEGYDELVSVLRSSPNLIAIRKIKDTPIAALPILAEAQVGFADAVIDTDGFLRRSQLGDQDSKGQYGFSLTIRLVEQYLKSEGVTLENGIRDFESMRFGNTEIPHFQQNTGSYVRTDNGGNQTLINYRAGKQPFDTVSYSEILSGAIDTDRLSDRILLVGYTALSIRDFQNSRAASAYYPSLVPGIAIQAHATSQILSAFYDDRPFLRWLPDALEYSLILAAGLIGMLLVRYRQRSRLQFLTATFVNVAWLLLSYWALLYGWWLPFIPVAVAFSLNAIALYPFYQTQAMLQTQISEKEKLIEQTYNIIHNDSLQIVSNMLSKWRKGTVISSKMREEINALNRELRGIRGRLNQEVLEGKLTIGGKSIDLRSPLDVVIQQVYDLVAIHRRDFIGSIYRKRNIEPVDDSNLSEVEKGEIGRFLEEAINNVLKHGQGVTRIEVELIQEGTQNVVRVTDNGQLFQQDSRRVSGGDGSRQAWKIAVQIGGKFSRRKKEPHGVVCELRWPIHKPLLAHWRK